MSESHLSELLWSAPVPGAERAQERAVDASRALAAARPATPVAGAPRRWRERRGLRIVALAGAGAIAIVAALAVFRGASPETEGTSFGSFAAIASAQPEAEFQHIEWDAVMRHSWPPHYAQGDEYPDVIEREDHVSLWVGEDQRYERGTHEEGGGGPNEVEYLFDRESGLSCFPNSMRLPFSIQYESGERFRYEGGSKEGASCGPDAFAQQLWTDLDLPTEPAALRQALEEEIRKPTERVRSLESGDDRGSGVTPVPNKEPVGTLPVPLSEAIEIDRLALVPELGLGPWDSHGLPLTQQLFSRALTYLVDPRSSPELRAALFQVLADLEGAVLETGRTDSLGREAALVTFTPPRTEGSEGATIREDVYLDPETSHVLEITTLVESERGVSADERVWGSYVETFPAREAVNSLPVEAQPLLDELDRTRAEG
jgi:hypothetical protein